MCGKMHRSDFLLGVIAVFLTLEEMKNYLRVDHEEDDGLLADLLKASERLCMDIARMEDQQEFEQSPNAKIAVQYAVAYQYEHREEADHHGDAKASNLDMFSLEMFENIAFIMAKHADPTIPDTPEEWLDQFNTFSIYQILPQLIELWGLNVKTDVEAKKNFAQQSVK